MEDNSQITSGAESAVSDTLVPKRLGADAFRRLTLLLKKTVAPQFSIPDIFPAGLAPSQAATQPVVSSEQSILPATVVRTSIVDSPYFALVDEPAPVLADTLTPTASDAADSIIPEAQKQFDPHLAQTPMRTLPFDAPPVLVEKITVEAAIEPHVLAEARSSIEVKAVTEVAPRLEPRASPRRPPKRDEFAEVLSVPKAAAPLLSPEQEAEQTELARSLIDMMSGAGGGGLPHERALAADTLLRMVPRLAQGIRAVLAQRLVMMEQPPPFLVQKLLADPDIAVSGPLLEDCMHIADENLFSVVAEGTPDQLRLIARRRRLSRAVTEAVIKVADPSVLLTLVRNAAAEIPQEGFAHLARMAGGHPDLLPPLCIRQDLPAHTAFELFWPAPVQLRRYLLTRFLTDSETLTRILRITMHGEEQASLEVSVEVVGAALEKALTGQLKEAAEDVAALLKISVALVERIFSDQQGEALMAVLKVAGVSRADLADNLPRLADGAHPLISASRNPEDLQAVFDQLSFTKGRILLTYWDWAATHNGPYAKQN